MSLAFSRLLMTLTMTLTMAFAASAARAVEGGAKLPANEMGQIMIFMYHKIGLPEITYVRSADHFRADLQNLYDRGYRLANLNDIIDGRITTEAGRTPVVLTFDDAAKGQINKIMVNGQEVWDPDSAVGIILEFNKKHPDMGVAGTFYINPFSNNMDRSRSAEWPEWIREMDQLGFEFGNHTISHPNFKKQDLTQPEVEHEIGGLQGWLHRYLPGYHIRTMAMPFGIYTAQTEWAVDGTYNGETYHHEALLKVGANPAPSPFSSAWKPLHLARIRAEDGQPGVPVSSFFIDFFDAHPGLRFVSDGNPDTVTVPAAQAENIRGDLSRSLRVIVR